MPWSNSVSQDRLWKMRIISCLWVAPLNKKAAAFVQLSWDFACRHYFLTYGREMQILHLPHMGSQSDLTSILDLNPIYLGVEKKNYFQKTTTECQTAAPQDIWKCICRLWWEEKQFSYETSCAGKKVTLYIYRRKNGTGEWYLLANCCIHMGNLKELKDVQHLAKTKKYVSQATSLLKKEA